MKTIIKRLEHLEHAHRTQIAANTRGVRAVLMEKLNGVAERLRAGGNWPPEPRPTVEEVKQRIREFVPRVVTSGRDQPPNAAPE
jgi:hypothetical protein